MALDDDAVVYPNTAHFFYDLAGAATMPTLAQLVSYVTDTSTVLTGLTNLGHTKLDNVAAFGSDGGDSSVKGSLQNKSLRQVITSEAVDYVTVGAMQMRDNQIMQFYYGGGDVTVADTFGTPDTPVIPNITFLMVIFDDNGPLGFFNRKCAVKRDDAIDLPADDFASMPLRFTPLKATGSPKVQWIGAGLGSSGA